MIYFLVLQLETGSLGIRALKKSMQGEKNPPFWKFLRRHQYKSTLFRKHRMVEVENLTFSLLAWFSLIKLDTKCILLRQVSF